MSKYLIAFMLTTMPAMADTVYLKYCPAIGDQCQLATYQCTNAWIPPDVRDCKPTGEFVWIDKIGEENNLR